MSDMCEMNLPTTSSFITDSRVRFVVEDIFFHQDTYGWDLYCPTSSNCNINSTRGNYLYTTYVVNNPEVINKYNSVHIFLGENQPNSKGAASSIGKKEWILLSATYYNYLINNWWTPSNGMRHELGHCLGLKHTWGNKNDDCSDTPGAPENMNCWNGDTCSNNVMDYNASKCAITECQFGRIHWYLMGHDGNISDCLIDDYLIYDESKSILIDNGESNTWEFDQFIVGDLIIDNNSSLTIKCTITMSPGGTIEVENGSILVLDGGQIDNANINVKNGGTLNIINNGKLVTSNNDEIYISEGGLLNFYYGSIE